MRTKKNTFIFQLVGMSVLLVVFYSVALAATTYTVKEGDTLDRIARSQGVSAQALIGANNLNNPDKLSIGQTLRIPSQPGAEKTYVVQAGDTLADIAQANGVSLLTLANYNHISDPNQLAVGQGLRIPSSTTVAAPVSSAPSYGLTPDLRRTLDSMRVVQGKWRYIVVHHSATRQGSAKAMDIYHRQKRHMENGLAYHFVIGNGRGMPDGKIEIGNRWKRQIKGGHLASERLNEISIGICLVGNFQTDRPTSQQLRSLYALIQYLEGRCRLGSSAVKLHRQINTKPTECPGKNFPAASLMKNI